MGQRAGTQRAGDPSDPRDGSYDPAYDRSGGRLPGDPVPVPDPGPGDGLQARSAGANPRRISYTRRFVRVLPALLIVAGALYEDLTPRDFTGGPLFTAAPLVAAPLYSLRGTVLTGAAAFVAALAVHIRLGLVRQAESATEMATVLTAAVLAVLINVLVRRGNARLASVREIAEAAQRAVLPEPGERIGALDVAARYEAAQEDAFIGGDLYAVQDSPYGVRLVVGDVRGKGMGAVAAVAVVIGAFREAAEQEASLEAVAGRLERALAREGTRREGLDAFEGFTTAVLAEIPRGEEVVRIVNRGHPPPLLLHADGALVTLDAGEPALPLGLGELGGGPDRAQQAEFPQGATLLLHTDGLSEARDGRGRFYDPAAFLAGRTFPAPGALLTALADEVRRHSGGRTTDDMALLAVRRP
ncbi:PP2C family protein-serine/threonine phosphatase [Streptomyces sp. NBC_00038]|uniref:PP2C family protein-serine/threonine phosphatase n=1 Tax=Streptomyces sp. NBC_00038 TaxID=2903615 RepID=UPI00224D35B2|nr:PP2C family protein-serine/threonine phosphatase [Streptomyces sp. NBC_00038]MCX5558842.1 serine/threonine-protein phosphatase [Streptomyces sp. NBC_00038]